MSRDGDRKHQLPGTDIVSLKKETISAIFQSCKESGNFTFDNEKVKAICGETGFKNPFDATKVDHSDLLPDQIRRDGYCVVHLGKGRHRFMQIKDSWYHQFEALSQNEKKEWEYKPSILNHTDTSESNIISLSYNQRIIQDFLYGDISASPKIYMSRRTKVTTSYHAGSEKIKVDKLQVELDATFEHNGEITVLEAKNGFPNDFAVYQIFLPSLDYHTKNIRGVEKVESCYLLKDKNSDDIRLYLYTFPDPCDISSIRLVKKAEYNLKAR